MLPQQGADGQALLHREGRILADFDETEYGSDYLTLACNERVLLLANRKEDAGWAYGARRDGRQGWFPASYWEPVEAPQIQSSTMAAAPPTSMTSMRTGAAGPSSAMMRAAPAREDDLGDPAFALRDQVFGRLPTNPVFKGSGAPASSASASASAGPSVMDAPPANAKSLKGTSSLTSALSSFGIVGDTVGLPAQQQVPQYTGGSSSGPVFGGSSSGPVFGGSSSGPVLAELTPATLAAAVAARPTNPAAKRASGSSGAQKQPMQNPDALADSRRQLLALLGRQAEEDARVAPAPAGLQSAGSNGSSTKAEQPLWAIAARVAAGRGGVGSASSAADFDMQGPGGFAGCGGGGPAASASRFEEADFDTPGFSGPSGQSGPHFGPAASADRFIEDALGPGIMPSFSNSGPPSGALPRPFASWQPCVYSRSTLLQARLASQEETQEEIPASAEERALLLGMQLAPRLAGRQDGQDTAGQKLREGAVATLLELAGGSAKVGQLAAAVLALGIKTGSHRQVCQSICVEVCSKPDTFVPLLEGALGIQEVNKLTVALRSCFPSDAL